MAGLFRVNGVDIKNPTTYKIERYNVTDLTRLANATMAGSLIAQKLKFYFTYDAITGADLDVILSAIWDSKEIFYTLRYPDNATTGNFKTARVYSGSIPTELHFASAGRNWVWKNVQFNLIEK